jgi:transmembrane sensor
MGGPDCPDGERLFEEAAAWFARMRGPEAQASRAKFEEWLSRGALQRSAYNHAAEIFAMGKLLVSNESPARPSGLRSPRRRTAKVAAGLVSLLLLLTGTMLLVRENPGEQYRPGQTARVQAQPASQFERIAAVGGPASARLSDGSLVRLANGTRIVIALTRSARSLTLEKGAARFFVAHEARPFFVHAGGGYVVARGTIFDVALQKEGKVSVRLIQGAVDVRSPAAAGGRAGTVLQRLRAGQGLTFAALAAPGLTRPHREGSVDGAATRELREGDARDFDSIRLADLVKLANARSSRPIRLADPATGDLRVSGDFRIDDTGRLADRLGALLGLAADRGDSRQIVLRPR